MKKPFKVGDKIKFVSGAVKKPHLAEVTHVYDGKPDIIEIIIRLGMLGHQQYDIHTRQVTHRIVKRPKRPKVTRAELAVWWDRIVHSQFPLSLEGPDFKRLCALVLGEKN